ncbi:MAG: T9SS type A sorting domain-containing protein [Salinivirgaceae bacterium]|nr:T9SS type A sorting domain-containing protein [Salinivirgaceae bacterium]
MNRIIYTIILSSLITLSYSQHTNVMISDDNYPEEPSICLNYLNPNYIVAGSNIDNCYFSTDAGLTWTYKKLTSTYGVWGDPAIISDKYGNFYFLHLSNPDEGEWIDRIVCQKSTDQGANWNNGSFLGTPSSKEHDKQWATVDFSNNTIYATWTLFDFYGSSSSNDKSNILFSKSTDNGETWTEPKQINELSGDCVDDDNTTEGAVPAVGPNGEVYVAWANNNKLYFDKSYDAGETWLDNDILIGDQPGGWAYDVPGISRCNGLPITCCDTSSSAHRGTIYVNWTDQRNGTENTDVWLSKSSNGGNTWSDAIKINNDETASHQFFTWMTIDQSNGYLYFVFYDRRNYTTLYTDVYMAVSKDGGETFENFKISEKPFLPNSGVFFGDYTNITAYNDIIRPIWTRLHNGDGESGLSVWTAIIKTDSIGVNYSEQLLTKENEIFPNPSSEMNYFSFKLKHATHVKLDLCDASGRIIKQLINEERPAGKYISSINIKNENLISGIYFYSLTTDFNKSTRKLIVTE